jgi:hypothetical protein
MTRRDEYLSGNLANSRHTDMDCCRLHLNDSSIRFPAACSSTKWRGIVFIKDQRRFASNEIGKLCHRGGRRSKPLLRETIGRSLFSAPAKDCDDRLDVNVGQCIAQPRIGRRFLKRDNLGMPKDTA